MLALASFKMSPKMICETHYFSKKCSESAIFPNVLGFQVSSTLTNFRSECTRFMRGSGGLPPEAQASFLTFQVNGRAISSLLDFAIQNVNILHLR